MVLYDTEDERIVVTIDADRHQVSKWLVCLKLWFHDHGLSQERINANIQLVWNHTCVESMVAHLLIHYPFLYVCYSNNTKPMALIDDHYTNCKTVQEKVEMMLSRLTA